MTKIVDDMAYFLKPIGVVSERKLALIARNDEHGPCDFNAALEVVVVFQTFRSVRALVGCVSI